MLRIFITILNCALLAVAFLGAPEVAGARFLRWQISSVSAVQTLTLWGLVMAATGNVCAALFLFKGSKERKLCWSWTMVFGALLGAEYAFVRGWLHFGWLRQILLWLQKHF